jgi:hypothetical protein
MAKGVEKVDARREARGDKRTHHPEVDVAFSIRGVLVGQSRNLVWSETVHGEIRRIRRAAASRRARCWRWRRRWPCAGAQEIEFDLVWARSSNSWIRSGACAACGRRRARAAVVLLQGRAARVCLGTQQ